MLNLIFICCYFNLVIKQTKNSTTLLRIIEIIEGILNIALVLVEMVKKLTFVILTVVLAYNCYLTSVKVVKLSRNFTSDDQ